MSTRTLSFRFSAAASLVLLLAACTSSSGASSAPATEATASAAESSAPASESAEASESASAGTATEIEAEDSDLGTILVDSEGNTIYFFANYDEGVSNCNSDCLDNWPPVAADGTPSAGDGVTAELGTMDGPEGSQLTVNGYPAYYFAGDDEPGDTNGQGVGDVWWVFGADGEPIEG